MSNHVHEWHIEGRDVLVQCWVCDNQISLEEVERRLNATEVLGAEDAGIFARILEQEEYDAPELRKYADILEGKQ